MFHLVICEVTPDQFITEEISQGIISFSTSDVRHPEVKLPSHHLHFIAFKVE